MSKQGSAKNMSYLVLTRREGEKITLRVQPGTDAEDLLAELLLDGITITVKGIKGGKAQIAIEAPLDLQILRSELEEA
ncbi:carbon storage regulator [Pseudomonas stutzeri]|uniref:carbon storage regulator n=2 Tax=Stutzerimonas stutzeri TaxID=316 RepID=UPI001111AC26|nr:carbon storage regulator [Stutzerimonas stutzeri]MBO0643716.1 carbon storage regulator [Stutzerimonas stutzeri]